VAPTALLALLGYVALDVATHLRKPTVEETARRVTAMAITFAIGAYFLSILYDQASNVYPSFVGLPVAAVWFVSLGLALFGAWVLYFEFEHHSRHALEIGIDLLLECANMLESRLKPLSEKATAGQASTSELSAKVAKLDESLAGLVSIIEAQGKAAKELTQKFLEISAQSYYRETEFKKAIAQHNKWYEERGDLAKVISDLIKSAENALEGFAVFSGQLDEYFDSVGVGERKLAVGLAQGAAVGGQKGDRGIAEAPEVKSQVPQTSGKLTTEKGIANRERGNQAQLKFAEETLRGAGKLLDNSIKEGTPDYVFYAPGSPEMRKAKAVGAFKALTLKEDGTRQRHIPRRKVLAELRTATKYAVPMILFVMNFTNGRIWAKVVPVNELKDFTGQTTPPMLVESDPQAEKTCKETLQMALNLL